MLRNLLNILKMAMASLKRQTDIDSGKSGHLPALVSQITDRACALELENKAMRQALSRRSIALPFWGQGEGVRLRAMGAHITDRIEALERENGGLREALRVNLLLLMPGASQSHIDAIIANAQGRTVADHAAEPPSRLERLDAYYTWDEAAQAWYFAPRHRADPPYKEQIHTDATIDLASDGTLAGIEIHDPRHLQECHARIKEILADSPPVS